MSLIEVDMLADNIGELDKDVHLIDSRLIS